MGKDSADVVLTGCRHTTHGGPFATASNAVPRTKSLSLEIDLASCPTITSCTPKPRPRPVFTSTSPPHFIQGPVYLSRLSLFWPGTILLPSAPARVGVPRLRCRFLEPAPPLWAGHRNCEAQGQAFRDRGAGWPSHLEPRVHELFFLVVVRTRVPHRQVRDLI